MLDAMGYDVGNVVDVRIRGEPDDMWDEYYTASVKRADLRDEVARELARM